MASTKRTRPRSGRTKAGSGPVHSECRDPEVPDLDRDPQRQKDKTLRLHQLGADVAACFATCTDVPRSGANYIDPRIALGVLLHHLVRMNLELAKAQGSGLAQRVGLGSGNDLDEMAKQVAWSFYQAADHNLRLEVRFKDLAWVDAHHGQHPPIIGPGCRAEEVPDLGDPALQGGKLERLHRLGKCVADAFLKCTGSNPGSPDYIDPRIALSILLVYLVSTNKDLVDAQGSALGGGVGIGSGKAIDDSAMRSAEQFLDEADHNIRMNVRYKALSWVVANKVRPGTRSKRARR